ncbi:MULTISPECIES: VOC family protein [Sphingobacterium]|uniref:VOC family protein n=1 Tax=Sphingobacterium tenebrionis TaxID=3111775 RepID=A0ABU8I6K7_9SPHI|nr:VOC family protein [Sphingobacterium sp. CZ-2]QBR11399.1 VOC family protein [Sphingobacterium sp. CZ-2]
MNNVINWFELPVNDLNRTKKIYENVLEISLTPMEFDGFKSLTFPFDGDNVSGALVENQNAEPNQTVILYFNAGEKLSPTLERVKENHGKIVMDSKQIKSGFIAHVLDNEGNKIALFALEA